MSYPLAYAQEQALKALQTLQPHCDRIDIVGSIRREKDFVNDVDILCIPKCKTWIDVFSVQRRGKRILSFQDTVKSLGTLESGDPAEGRQVRLLAPGIKIDLFITEESDYYRLYATRTGSAEYSRRILANAWTKRGWVGTAEGLRREEQCKKYSSGVWKCTAPRPELPPVWKSEREFFSWLGVHWIPPKDRQL